jgi:anti-sigma factor RsiW
VNVNRNDSEPIVARDATYYRAPDGLRGRIHSALKAEARDDGRSRWPAWGAILASAAAAALVSWNVALMQTRAGGEERVARDVASAHVRSLLAENHLNDVASSDQHAVKPWFQGKLDFAPVVADLTSAGYPLVGGRLDYVNGRAVPAIVYKHRLHVINVFEWPASSAGDEAPQLITRQGFSLVRWKRGGLEYWAVSDAAGADVLKLAQLLAS